MNIQEYVPKIKGFYKDRVVDQTGNQIKLYFAFIIILTAFASFGLGRLSGQNNTSIPVRIVSPSVTLGSNAYTSQNDGKKVKIIEPVIVASVTSRFYTFTWCPLAQNIRKDDQKFFYSILDAVRAGFAPDLTCNGLK